MAFDYGKFVAGGVGKQLAGALGLPQAATLRRHDPKRALIPGAVLVAGHDRAPAAALVRDWLHTAGIAVASVPSTSVAAVVLDLTDLETPRDLETVRATIAPALKTLQPSGRIIVVGRPPESAATIAQGAARRAVEGIVRSIGKEMRAGGTANTILVHEDGDLGLEAPIRFLLSGRSATSTPR